jgi:hypothetical protein
MSDYFGSRWCPQNDPNCPRGDHADHSNCVPPNSGTAMTIAHEQHLTDIIQSFRTEVDKKYRAGVKQHGGTLWTKPFLIEKAMEECIDQYVFLYTLKMQRDNPGMIDPDAKDIDA